MSEQPIQENKKKKPSSRLLNYSIFFLCLIASIPVGVAYWRLFYRSVLEIGSPDLLVQGIPEGFGTEPVPLTLRMRDNGSGLDEIVIRIKQRSLIKEILREKLQGKRDATLEYTFDAKQLKLNEGKATLLVRVFDRAIWSNSAEAEYEKKIEYRPPRIKAVTAQHNARTGGSQLILYTASDDDQLLESGIMVGEQFFPGFPAKLLDKDLTDPDLFACIYVVDVRSPADAEPLLMARDDVGNIGQARFTNQIFQRRGKPQRFQGSEEQLQGFREQDLTAHLKNTANPITWRSPFLVPKAGVNLSFGDDVIYPSDQGELKKKALGFRFRYFSNDLSVVAAQDGVVAFIFEGQPGESVIGIDHGAGLYSIYSHLGSVAVTQGSKVSKGAIIAIAKQKVNDISEMYFEIRQNGIPADPREWWDENWVNDHIQLKIREVRWTYGLGVKKPAS